MRDVVVVGQTPPPTHGQAVMVEALMRMSEPGLRLHLVRLGSDSLADVGRVRVGKLLQLVRVCASIRHQRRATGADTLYLAIGGAGIVPLVRDTLLLGVVRHGFQRVVLHVHGAGVGGALARLPAGIRRAVLVIRGRPDVVIELSPESPADGSALRARAVAVVPNGIPAVESRRRETGRPPSRLLFLGTLRASKGVLLLIETVVELIGRGYDLTLTLAGDPVNPAFGDELAAAIAATGLADRIQLVGHLDDAGKPRAFAEHDVFVFPSFYDGENLSVAVIEAMRAGLPVIAARWRGASDLVDDGVSGLLVPPGDAVRLAQAIARLQDSPTLAAAMGMAGHERFLQRFSETAFHRSMAGVLRRNSALSAK